MDTWELDGGWFPGTWLSPPTGLEWGLVLAESMQGAGGDPRWVCDLGRESTEDFGPSEGVPKRDLSVIRTKERCLEGRRSQ